MCSTLVCSQLLWLPYCILAAVASDTADREPVDPTADLIAIDGTLQFCTEIDLTPEDVLLLAIAHELKSPRMGEWTRKGWVDGWKALGCVLLLVLSSQYELKS